MFSRRSVLTRVVGFLTTTALVLGITLLSPTWGIAQSSTTLTVSAGAGLRDVMEEIQDAYAHHVSNVTINYNFAASGVLRQQVEQGAPVDLIVMASQDEMNGLQNQNLLLEGTRRNLLQSEVALVVPSHSTGISNFQDLADPTVQRIAIGEPRTVPLGRYAEEVFNYFGILNQIQSKLVYAQSALEILSYVESGNVEAGIVHDTNARQSDQVQIVAIAPAASHTPVIYPIAILRTSAHPIAARAFLQFLSGSEARTIFQRYGYGLPPQNG